MSMINKLLCYSTFIVKTVLLLLAFLKPSWLNKGYY